jgi:hypothetical protein
MELDGDDIVYVARFPPSPRWKLEDVRRTLVPLLLDSAREIETVLGDL